MEMKYTMISLGTVRPQPLYRPTVWRIMSKYVSLTGCNAYRFKPASEQPEFCDCHNCIDFQLDIMETIQMEIALEVKHG